MIFQTQNQLNCIFIFIFFGIVLGFVLKIFNLIFLEKYQKKSIKIIINSIFYSIFNIFFIFLINFFNFGNFSLVLILCYIFGFAIIKNHTFKLVVFLEKKWYNFLQEQLKNKTLKNKGTSNLNEQSKKS